MTTDPLAPTGPSGPRTPAGEANGVEAERPLSGSVKCVGAFLMPCPNVTDAIMCGDCYDKVERVLSNIQAPGPRRFSPRPHNGMPT